MQQQHVERRERRADHPVGDPRKPASALDPLGEHALGDVGQNDLQPGRGGEYNRNQGTGLRGWRDTTSTASGPYPSTTAISTNASQWGEGPAWTCSRVSSTSAATRRTVASTAMPVASRSRKPRTPQWCAFGRPG